MVAAAAALDVSAWTLCCHWRQGKGMHTHTHTLNVEPPKLISQTCDFQFQTGDTNPTLNIHAECSSGLLTVPGS